MRRASKGMISLLLLPLSASAWAGIITPGLWEMREHGTIQIQNPPVSEPFRHSAQLCIRPETEKSQILPNFSGNCSKPVSTPGAAGKTLWHWHCSIPQGTVTGSGWIQSTPDSYDSQWVVTTRAGASSSTVHSSISGRKLAGRCAPEQP